MVQMNVPEDFLDPMGDKKPQTSEEELAEKVEKTVLLRHNSVCWQHKPKNGPTRTLATAVWLKLRRKYFNTGTMKEACELFKVRAKQLSQVLTGCKHLGGGKKGGGKRKVTPPTKKVKKMKDDDDDDQPQEAQ